MLIGIEAARANKPQKTGVEWYAWHVIQGLKQLTAHDPHSWLLYTHRYLQGGLEIHPENWFEVRASWPFPYGWTQMRLAWELFRRPADVIFLPGTTMPRYVSGKSVVTVHDLGFCHAPQLYKPRQVLIHNIAMKEVMKRAARIIAVSEYTKQDLVSIYHCDPARISVTPLGVDHDVYRPLLDGGAIEERLHRYRIAKPFFVCIGRLEAKKNILTLIQAFGEFKRRHGIGDPHTLVLVGIPGFHYQDIRRAIDTSPARSHILEIGYVPEQDLPALLNAAEALIHPSWFEGFGLPPLMAMASGCPVIASNAGSLPEVVGDAGILVRPDQPEAFIAAMDRLVYDVVFRESLRVAGISRAAAFTWKRTAELTRPVLTEW